MISVPIAYQKILSVFADVYGNFLKPRWIQKINLTNLVEESQGKRYLLQEDILANRFSPPFDKSMMDGIAVNHQAFNAGIREFKLVGFQAAGEAPKKVSRATEAMEIGTGAPLPNGTDCVIPYEIIDIIENNGSDYPWARVSPSLTSVQKMAHVQPKGKEYVPGDLLIDSGSWLSSKQVAVLASIGKTKMKVHRFPSVGLVITGNELVPIEQTPKPWQIRASNGHMIESYLREWGWSEVETVYISDDREEMIQQIDSFIKTKDWVLVTGSLSKGKYDFVPQILNDLKAITQFYRVRQKPGKPFLFATKKVKTEKMIFGLPGNPVSALVCLRRYILAAYGDVLANLAPFKMTMSQPIHFDKKLTYFPLVSWDRSQPGKLISTQHFGSGDFFSLVGSDGFIEIPEESNSTDSLEAVTFYPWQLF